jgi:hypothetical protein
MVFLVFFFLQSLQCLAALCQFVILHNMAAPFSTSPSHLLLGFLVGLLPLRLPSRINFGIKLSDFLTTFPDHLKSFNMHVHYQAIQLIFLCSPNTINFYYSEYSPHNFFSKKPIIFPELWKSIHSHTKQ